MMMKCCGKSRLRILRRAPFQRQSLAVHREEISKGQEQSVPWEKEGGCSSQKQNHHRALKGILLYLGSLVSSSHCPVR